MQANKKIKVAAYARVSTDSSEQRKSFESQVQYYKTKIESNPNWEYTKVYADEGITGTSTKNRNGFNEMMFDAKLRRFDILLVKSISRLARNTIDALSTVRTFKENGIRVISEEERIDTQAQESEFILTLMASLAQQESEKMSERVKVGLKHKAELKRTIGGQRVYGYYKNSITKEFEINEEEAKNVKFIFEKYLEGYGSTLIARELNMNNIPGPLGNKWHDSAIIGIAKNEKYIGRLVQCKTTVDNIFTKRRKKCEEPIVIENAVPRIIDDETFNKVQEILKSRGTSRQYSNTISQHLNVNTFTSKLRCGCCGKNFCLRITNRGTKAERRKWICSNKAKNSVLLCPLSKGVEEDMIKEAFEESIKAIQGDYSKALDEFIELSCNSLDGNSISKKKLKIENDIQAISKQRDKLIDLYSKDIISSEELDEKIKKLDLSIYKLDEELINISKTKTNYEETKKSIQGFKRKLEDTTKDGIKFEDNIFRKLVNYIIVGGYEENIYNPFKLQFVFNISKTNEESLNEIIIFPLRYKNINFIYNDKGSKEKTISSETMVTILI